MKAIEVDFAGVAEMDRMLVTALASLGGTTLFLVKVDGNTEVVALQALAGPEILSAADHNVSFMQGGDLPGELVGVVDPAVGGLAQGGLHCLGVPDLLEQDALGVI